MSSHLRYCFGLSEKSQRMAKSGYQKDSYSVQIFMDDTTLHGLKKTCSTDLSPLRRLLWAAVMAATMSSLVVVLQANVKDYLRYVGHFLHLHDDFRHRILGKSINMQLSRFFVRQIYNLYTSVCVIFSLYSVTTRTS